MQSTRTEEKISAKEEQDIQLAIKNSLTEIPSPTLKLDQKDEKTTRPVKANLKNLNPVLLEDALAATKQILKELETHEQQPSVCIGIHYAKIKYSRLPSGRQEAANELVKITCKQIHPIIVNEGILTIEEAKK